MTVSFRHLPLEEALGRNSGIISGKSKLFRDNISWAAKADLPGYR